HMSRTFPVLEEGEHLATQGLHELDSIPANHLKVSLVLFLSLKHDPLELLSLDVSVCLRLSRGIKDHGQGGDYFWHVLVSINSRFLGTIPLPLPAPLESLRVL